MWRVYIRGTGVRRMRSHPPVTSAKHVRFSSILRNEAQHESMPRCHELMSETPKAPTHVLQALPRALLKACKALPCEGGAHRKAAEALTLANESRLSMSSPGSCARLITAVSTCAATKIGASAVRWANQTRYASGRAASALAGAGLAGNGGHLAGVVGAVRRLEQRVQLLHLGWERHNSVGSLGTWLSAADRCSACCN